MLVLRDKCLLTASDKQMEDEENDKLLIFVALVSLSLLL